MSSTVMINGNFQPIEIVENKQHFIGKVLSPTISLAEAFDEQINSYQWWSKKLLIFFYSKLHDLYFLIYMRCLEKTSFWRNAVIFFSFISFRPTKNIGSKISVHLTESSYTRWSPRFVELKILQPSSTSNHSVYLNQIFFPYVFSFVLKLLSRNKYLSTLNVNISMKKNIEAKFSLERSLNDFFSQVDKRLFRIQNKPQAINQTVKLSVIIVHNYITMLLTRKINAN